ncbi:TIGR00282 family metallophosphoesterase [Candidatus Sumerlaeota bacterium]|nr:TIGR00282 family metallophosphoesterase [Candidatus Sumerlaeota bacterium]
MKILFVGDIIGSPGRQAVRRLLPALVHSRGIEFVVANAENAAGGKGLTPAVAQELFAAGVDVLTNGNHVWQHKEILGYIEKEERVLRPANYPQGVGVPGRGSGVYVTASGVKIAVLNLIGRVFMHPYDCPFRVGGPEAKRLRRETPVVIVDFHAEATSEKIAMGWYLNGEVSAVVGTHTHVATADERVSPEGTALITDVGMTGPFDSVIGVVKEPVIEAMIKMMPARHVPAKGDVRLCGLVIEVDAASGRASDVERVCLKLKETVGGEEDHADPDRSGE